MTRVFKWLSGSLAAVLLLGAAGLMTDSADAQSPPARPARFAGSVMIDGEYAAPGTAIVAKVGDASCGTTSVFTEAGEARYVIDVAASEPTNSPNCGSEGAAVSFMVNGHVANETGSWIDFDLNLLNLTVTTMDDEETPTPGAPDTGSGMASTGNGSSASVLFAALGLGALALGLGGATVAARRS